MKKTVFIIFFALIIFKYSFSENQNNEYKPNPYSIQMHSLTGNHENHKKSIDLIKALGIKQVRDEFFWHEVEKVKGEYKIPERYLKNVEYSCANGIDTLIILDYGNMLYEEGMAPTKEESLKAFAQYAYTLAKELKGKVKYFEVWNEPNTDGFWKPKANPKDYANLLKYVYPAVKKGNPDAVVIGMTVAGLDIEFMEKVLAENVYDFMDAISVHPYCTPKSPEEAEIFEKIKSFYESLRKYGKQKPIWITEVGWPTNTGGGVSEDKQADFVIRQYLLTLANPFVKTNFIYWFGPDGDDETWAEDRFGIIHQDYSPKPAYIALQNLISLLKDAKFDKILPDIKDDKNSPDNNLKALKFINKDNSITTVIWAVEKLINIRIKTQEDMSVTFMNGDKKTLSPHNDFIYLTASPSPLYITSAKDINIEKAEENIFSIKLEDNTNILSRGLGKTMLLKNFNNEQLPVNITFIPLDKEIISVSGSDNNYTINVSDNSRKSKTIIRSVISAENEKNPHTILINEFSIDEPVKVQIYPVFTESRSKKFKVIIFNSSGKILSGDINLKCELLFRNDPLEIKLSENKLKIEKLAAAKLQEFIIDINSEIDDSDILKISLKSVLEGNINVSHTHLIDFYKSYKTKNTLKIDGDLSDWAKNISPIKINHKDQYSGGYQKWDGINDSSANIYTSYDDKWFYLGIELTDDIYSDPVEGFGIYNNDGCEIYFDTDYQSDFDEGIYSTDDHQYGVFPSMGKDIVYSWSQLKGESKNSKIKINRSPKKENTVNGFEFKGMIIEAAILLKELGINPAEGHLIRFNASFTDDDDPRTIHPFFQEIQMTWTGKKNSWQNPTNFGFLFFGE